MEAKLMLGHYLIWVMILLGQLNGYKACIQKERNALLELKKYPNSVTWGNDTISDFEGLFTTWTNDTTSDCCHWEGVTCNHTSRRVIGLSIGRMFDGKIPLLNLSLLHPFEEVRSLDLSLSRFSGFFDDVEGYKSLKRLKNLEILDISYNSFNNSIFPFLNAAASLKTLFLGGNNMDGLFPVKELSDLKNLRLLDLSENRIDGFKQVRDLHALRKLKALDLHGNGEYTFSYVNQSLALIALGICELKNIEELNLSHNNLVGEFPLCLTSLTGLRVLDLSSNKLTGKLPSALGNLKSLEYLSLFDNDFNGFFSLGWLANLSELTVLKLSSKSNSLEVEADYSWKPKSRLNVIVLRSCNLEKVPQFLLHQKDLRQVDLSDNKVTGIFPSWLLANNTKLENLLLQNNFFTGFQLPKSAHNLLVMDASVNEFSQLFPENIGWILPRLQHMNLANNGFHGNLPSSLGNMKSIAYLDLSHNSFYGKLPTSFLKGCYSLSTLKLSHNKLSGQIFPGSTNFTYIEVLSMENNQFTGKIGKGLRSLKYLQLLDISYNNLTGVIPSWFDELPNIGALLISNNLLEGEIPISLFNLSNLQLLDLSANHLSGGIPPYVNSGDGVVLLLQDNNLSGVIPETLLGNVTILNLRNNKLSGSIPEFVNTETIKILLLRGNNLTGSIPRQLCASIHLLDLANNRLNGFIPSCLSNASFGLGEEYESPNYNFDIYSVESSSIYRKTDYTENVGIYLKYLLMLDQNRTSYEAATETKIEFATKHRYDAYMGENLGLLRGIDLSRNELSGEIPVELGDLVELHSLDLSHNNLSGVIPESFSGMKNLENLDLSFNRLQGRIPPQLTELNNLEVFNVSYNNLSGVIPQGRQFNTFDIQSFLGNHLLCGQLINKSCKSNNFQELGNEVGADESLIDMVSFYWSFAAAYVTLLLGIFASLSFDSPWSRGWFYIVDVSIHKVRNLLS